jgi:hypothetical protein
MNPTPLTQILSNNQKEIIAGVFLLIATIITGVFLLISTSMTKETPAPVVNNYNYAPTYTTINMAATPAPQVAPKRKAPQPRKQHRKLVAKPQPSCPCAGSTKAGA